ncbi:MAG: cell division protein FtsL [Leptothrix ochracea]|jgi:cell division protein FtsL|uniref:cell division protein FtsL n=1 Tax=Leptothrix ochracea TaxID=735331 RepID=UPI0034E2FC0E
MTTRLNLLLLLALIISAVYLVRTSYESRRVFVALEHEHVEARLLASEDERLQVEQRAQATHLRVDRLAREQLQMRTATPAVTQYVDDRTLRAIPVVRSSSAPASAVGEVRR